MTTEEGTGTPRRFAVGVVVHPVKPVADSLAVITAWAARQGVDVLARGADATRVGPDVTLVADDELVRRVDVLVSLGGDGTMLGALRLTVGHDVPVLGVNHGNLGFLVELTPDDLEPALDRLAEGTYTLEPHHGLQVQVGSAQLVGFNDVVLVRRAEPGGVSVDLAVNGAQHGYYRSDAVVVATPTGSTAYSYAAGGPVVSPSAAAIVVTPVAPMSGINRSVVLGTGDEVVLHAHVDGGAVDVEVDGVRVAVLPADGRAVVRTLTDAAQVVRLDAGQHARRSRIKLSLLDLPLRPDQLRELVPPELRHRADEVQRRGARALRGDQA